MCKEFSSIECSRNVETWVKSFPLSPGGEMWNSVSWNLPKKQVIVLCFCLCKEPKQIHSSVVYSLQLENLPTNRCFWVNLVRNRFESLPAALPSQQGIILLPIFWPDQVLAYFSHLMPCWQRLSRALSYCALYLSEIISGKVCFSWVISATGFELLQGFERWALAVAKGWAKSVGFTVQLDLTLWIQIWASSGCSP